MNFVSSFPHDFVILAGSSNITHIKFETRTDKHALASTCRGARICTECQHHARLKIYRAVPICNIINYAAPISAITAARTSSIVVVTPIPWTIRGN